MTIESARLKQMRLKHNLTQAQLAGIIGVDRVTIARWERGKHEPLPIFRRLLVEKLSRKAS